METYNLPPTFVSLPSALPAYRHILNGSFGVGNVLVTHFQMYCIGIHVIDDDPFKNRCGIMTLNKLEP